MHLSPHNGASLWLERCVSHPAAEHLLGRRDAPLGLPRCVSWVREMHLSAHGDTRHKVQRHVLRPEGIGLLMRRDWRLGLGDASQAPKALAPQYGETLAFVGEMRPSVEGACGSTPRKSSAARRERKKYPSFSPGALAALAPWRLSPSRGKRRCRLGTGRSLLPCVAKPIEPNQRSQTLERCPPYALDLHQIFDGPQPP